MAAIRRSRADIAIDAVIYSILILLCITMILPFMQVITISMSPAEEVNRTGFHFIPKKFNFEGYWRVFKHNLVWNAYFNTIARTVIGTSLSVLLTVLGAYPLSKKYLPNRTFWTGIIVFTMYFHGGLIPSYLLVKNLGLMDSLWALILPGAVSAFNLIVTRNFFMTLPESVEESARIDGANDIYILFKIIIPLSMPIIATISLWYGVHNWNAWFDCMIYIMDQKKFVLQYVLRLILLDGRTQDLQDDSTVTVATETMKMATLVVATLPIVCSYPFLQKYFVKGVMVGSLKG